MRPPPCQWAAHSCLSCANARKSFAHDPDLPFLRHAICREGRGHPGRRDGRFAARPASTAGANFHGKRAEQQSEAEVVEPPVETVGAQTIDEPREHFSAYEQPAIEEVAEAPAEDVPAADIAYEQGRAARGGAQRSADPARSRGHRVGRSHPLAPARVGRGGRRFQPVRPSRGRWRQIAEPRRHRCLGRAADCGDRRRLSGSSLRRSFASASASRRPTKRRCS